MVCPMKNDAKKVEVGTEYPYQSLYRPWSWIFSSFFNLFLFAALIGILYLMYRTRKSRKQKHRVTYRTAQASEATASDGKKGVALVTGGNGTLGRQIIKSLVADAKYVVHSLDILLPEEENRMEGVSMYIQADITNSDDLDLAFRDVDVVFHCASLTPISIRHSKEDYYRVNVEGTKNVIKACVECGVKRLLYTSSASVTVSKNPKVVSTDSDESCAIPSDPLNIYIETKGKADQLVREANGKGGVLTCALRPNAFVRSIFMAFHENLYCPSTGDFEISIVSIESAARAHILAEKKLLDGGEASVVAGKAYNVSEGKATMTEFVKFLASEKNTSATFIPFSLIRFLAMVNEVVYRVTGFIAISESLSTISVDYKSHTYVSDLAREELGWSPGMPWRDVVKALLKKKGEDSRKEKLA